MNPIGRMLDSPPDPEIDPDTITEAEEILLDDATFLATFITSNDEVYKHFEREVLKKAAEIHDNNVALALDSSIGDRDDV